MGEYRTVRISCQVLAMPNSSLVHSSPVLPVTSQGFIAGVRAKLPSSGLRVPSRENRPRLKGGRRPRPAAPRHGRGVGGVHRTQEKTERLARFPFFSAVLFVGRNVGRKCNS